MANKGDRTIRVRDPARVVEWHIDKYRRTRTGSVVAVHHVGLGKWVSMRDYYLWQKEHELRAQLMPVLAKVVEGGYRMSAAIYSFMPSVLGVPIPAGPALLTAAITDLVTTNINADPQRYLKALFKVAGPFGALLQTYESLNAIINPPPPAEIPFFILIVGATEFREGGNFPLEGVFIAVDSIKARTDAIGIARFEHLEGNRTYDVEAARQFSDGSFTRQFQRVTLDRDVSIVFSF